MMSAVTTYYLEMHRASDILGKAKPNHIEVIEAKHKEFRFNRFLYQLVGEPWQWKDKLKLDDATWQAYAEADNLHTFVAYSHGAIAGYFELQQQQDGDVEIAYFGLTPRFIGQGFGGYLLTECLQQAWQLEGTKRVYVHTCNLDHPSALSNYQARGLTLYQTVVE